jgi:hypothetical protein
MIFDLIVLAYREGSVKNIFVFDTALFLNNIQKMYMFLFATGLEAYGLVCRSETKAEDRCGHWGRAG